MGFYGNITNTSKTQFQFDRIYSSRSAMENKMYTDNIYAGRYVLVEYDSTPELGAFSRVYIRGSYAYKSPNFEATTRITKAEVKLGTIVYTASNLKEDSALVPSECIFYVCTTDRVEGSTEPALWKEVIESTNSYTINYNIDTAAYGPSRGYDSTVWQKAYIDGLEKYVQIAELNSVIPTFDIAADAPTMEPITPHFDVNSTNVYYKLHTQPQWGLRVKEKDNNVTLSENVNVYPSDVESEYTRITYNPATGSQSKNTVKYDGAIYYNKAGFDKNIHTHNDELDGQDIIQIEPTGLSGNKYNVHGSSKTKEQVDIQELRIILPSLGNTISDIWDLIYGYDVENNVRYRDIEWKDAVTGVENTDIGGMNRDINTIAGCINNIHDLIGMIITDKTNASLTEEWFVKNLIYKDGNNYYRIHKYPLYDTVIIGELELPKRDQYQTDQEYNTDYEKAIKDKLQDKEYYLIINQDSENYQVKVLNEKAISSLNDADIIGYQNDNYGYEYQLIENLPGQMATLYGSILQMKNLLEVEDSETRDQTTVTGAVNALNDIIEVFEDLVPGEFLICDKNGHVNSANWTTAQDFKYTNYGESDPTAVDKIFNTKENRWIDLSLDKNNNLITIKHNYNPIEDTTTVNDKNESTDDYLYLYTPIVDNTGHIVGKNLETVTLPFGYNSITTSGSTKETKDLDTKQDSVSEDGSTVTSGTPIGESSISADSSKDSVAFNPYNKWIQIKADTDTDTISIAHEVHGIQSNSLQSDLNDSNTDNKNSIICQDLVFDEAGHVTKNQSHEYTLPYGFKTISADKEGTSTDSLSAIASSQNIVADNTQDELVVKGGNKWIRVNVAIEEKEGEDKKKTLLIGHNTVSFPQGVTAGTEYGLSTDANATSIANNSNQFSIPSLQFDQAGHITEAYTRTVTLPNNFASLKVNGEKNPVNSSVTNITGNTVDISPDKLVDSFQLEQGNRWITLVGNDTSNTIAFYHNAPLSVTPLPTLDDINPSFGGSFDIPNVQYDVAGHTYGVVNQKVTLPTPNLIVADNKSTASVMTGLTLNSTTFRFTEQVANVGSLVLTGYADTEGNNSALAATDSINTAFNKLQRQINQTSDVVASLELTAQEGHYIAGLTIQEDGTFELIEKALPVIPDYTATFENITNRLKALEAYHNTPESEEPTPGTEDEGTTT